MSKDGLTTWCRCLAVWGGLTLVAGAILLVALPAVADLGTAATAAQRPDRALVGCCAVGAVLSALWLWGCTGVVVLAALRGRTTAIRGIPSPLRRALLAGCGLALATGLAVPAGATPGAPHQAWDGPADASLAGLPYPDRAATALPGRAHLDHGHSRGPHRSDPDAGSDDVVVVVRGDTLWSIAAQALGPDASDAEIDARWRAIYRLNRAAIGADPDLIRPAQRLRLPIERPDHPSRR